MANNKTIVDKNILDSIVNVINNKGYYETSKVNGGDYEQYRTAAQPSYQYLIDNGWGDIANSLQNSNFITSQDILKRYGLADSATDKAGSFVNTNMENLKSFLPNTSETYNNYQSGINSKYNDFTNKANSSYKDTQNYLTPYMQNLNDLYGKYSIGVDTVNSQNNQLWNDMRQFGSEQTGRYDKLTDYIYNNDYTATPWYQTIMEGYNLQGGNAAGDAIASAGGSNSGNIDSYAAANANRQQLSFTNAGNNAALNAYNSQLGNLLGTIQSLGYDIGNLQNRQQANIDSSRTANQGMLDSYNTGYNNLGNLQNDAVNNLLNAYGMAGQNYNTGYNNLMGAKNTEYQTTANAFNDILSRYADLDANQKNYDIQEATQKNSNELAQLDYLAKLYGYDTSLAGTKYTTDSSERQNTANNEASIAIQKLLNELGYNTNSTNLSMNQNTSNATIKSADAAANASKYNTKYSTDAEERMNTDNNTSNEKIAGIKNPQEPTATYETIQSNLYDLLNGYGVEKVDINVAQQILLDLYPGSADRINAVVQDYKAKQKT